MNYLIVIMQIALIETLFTNKNIFVVSLKKNIFCNKVFFSILLIDFIYFQLSILFFILTKSKKN